MTESLNSFDAKKTLDVNGKSYDYFDINTVPGMEKLPYSLKVLAENLLRNEDGKNVNEDHIKALANWDPKSEPDTEIQFTPARVLMQDFTGVPCVVDLATMREAVSALGGTPDQVNPLNPAEMVIDHSVIVEAQEHYTLTTGRVLTLIVAANEGDDIEAILSSVRDASHEHPSRVLVVIAGSHLEETHLDAELRVGGEAGASEIVVMHLKGALSAQAESVVGNPFVILCPGFKDNLFWDLLIEFVCKLPVTSWVVGIIVLIWPPCIRTR